MKAPVIPFEGYKWRWAVLTPTEGLNAPSVFLGVLRALKENEGERPNSPKLFASLVRVEEDANSKVALARTQRRNLIRNSGQYWKALDLLDPQKGYIQLTELGRKVADGAITKTEFAATTIKTLELPNSRIESDATVREWEKVGLKIKPLQLILEIMCALFKGGGARSAYLTPDELVRIVIPLAGIQAGIKAYLEALQLFRSGDLDTKSWPDCAPAANDKRMAREFLLFLQHYGFCNVYPAALAADEKYFLADLFDMLELNNFLSLQLSEQPTLDVVQQVKKTEFPYAAERRRVLTDVIARPQQAAFRNKVLKAYKSRCLLTGVVLETVLEAAHIIPVSEKGIDEIINGLCLRSDIHLLFDSGHLRIDTGGKIHLSETAAMDINYGHLPSRIDLPKFISTDFVKWRWEYT
ncbi:HNH endonuclease [Geobacter anodireducens]